MKGDVGHKGNGIGEEGKTNQKLGEQAALIIIQKRKKSKRKNSGGGPGGKVKKNKGTFGHAYTLVWGKKQIATSNQKTRTLTTPRAEKGGKCPQPTSGKDGLTYGLGKETQSGERGLLGGPV